MFSRIGQCIKYSELSIEEKVTIISNWYDQTITLLDEEEKELIANTDIKDWFEKNAGRYDNIRILKTKLENAIFERLTEKYIMDDHE